MFAIQNYKKLPCKGCGEIHPYITHDERVVLVSSGGGPIPRLGREIAASDPDVKAEIERVGSVLK